MRTIMSRTPYEGSFSFSRRHFNLNNWFLKRHASSGHADGGSEMDWDDEGPIPFAPEPSDAACHATNTTSSPVGVDVVVAKRRSAVSRLRSAFVAALASSTLRLLVVSRKGVANSGRVTGTVFGPRRGRVHLAFQPDPRSPPLLLLELSTPTSSLVTEMASGLVRIALECDGKSVEDGDHKGGGGGGSRRRKRQLLEEPSWRAYCNGRKLGSATRRDPRDSDLDVLNKVGPVSMGAGVVVRGEGGAVGDTGAGTGSGKAKLEQVMYMRAGFERVVGSPDSMAFYMVGPEGGAASGPELSIYLLRV